MRDVAIVSFAQAPLDQPPGRPRPDAVADDHRGPRARRARRVATCIHVLGQRRLPGRRHVHVRADARSGRRVAADLRVARRDGRRVGAVRGVGAVAARRRRRRARVRLGSGLPQRVAARDSALQHDPYYLVPLGADHVSLSALQAQAVLAATGRTERDLAEIVGARSPTPGRANRRRLGRLHRRRSARQGLRGRAAARRTTRAAGRRCRRDRARRRRPGPRPRASGPRGSRASTTAPIRTTRGCATSRSRRRRDSRPSAPVSAGGVEVAELTRVCSSDEVACCRRARPRRRRRRQSVGRCARRQPDDGDGARPHRRGVPPDQRAAAGTARSATRAPARACSRTSSASSEASSRPMAERCAVVGDRADQATRRCGTTCRSPGCAGRPRCARSKTRR